jgi:hypothetical protein
MKEMVYRLICPVYDKYLVVHYGTELVFALDGYPIACAFIVGLDEDNLIFSTNYVLIYNTKAGYRHLDTNG